MTQPPSLTAMIRNYLLTAWLFAGTALIILSLALLTVCTQAIRTALNNPIKSLRTE